MPPLFSATSPTPLILVLLPRPKLNIGPGHIYIMILAPPVIGLIFSFYGFTRREQINVRDIIGHDNEIVKAYNYEAIRYDARSALPYWSTIETINKTDKYDGELSYLSNLDPKHYAHVTFVNVHTCESIPYDRLPNLIAIKCPSIPPNMPRTVRRLELTKYSGYVDPGDLAGITHLTCNSSTFIKMVESKTTEVDSGIYSVRARDVLPSLEYLKVRIPDEKTTIIFWEEANMIKYPISGPVGDSTVIYFSARHGPGYFNVTEKQQIELRVNVAAHHFIRNIDQIRMLAMRVTYGNIVVTTKRTQLDGAFVPKIYRESGKRVVDYSGVPSASISGIKIICVGRCDGIHVELRLPRDCTSLKSIDIWDVRNTVAIHPQCITCAYSNRVFPRLTSRTISTAAYKTIDEADPCVKEWEKI